MKKILFLVWMGLIILGLNISTIVDSGNYENNDIEIEHSLDFSDISGRANIFNTRGTRGEAWYINTSKSFEGEDHTLDMDIIINETGSLTIRDATITIDQTHDYEYKILIKDYGKLVLDNSTLKSNYALAVYIQDFGNLKLSRNSQLKMNRFEAKGNSRIVMDSSEIANDNNSLTIYLFEFSGLEMKQHSVINCKVFSGEGKSSLTLDNSNIIAKIFTINCSKVYILNNNNVNNFAIDSCLNFTVSNSIVQNLEVLNCITISFLDSTSVKDSLIDIASNIIITESQASNLSVNYCTEELVLSQADILNLEVFECDLVLITNNTKVRASKITSCKSLTISDIYLDSLDVNKCHDSVSIISSTINHLKVLAPYIYVLESDIACNEEELNLLTRSSTFYAINSTFNLPLYFKSETSAHLVNVDTNEKMPEVHVADNAIVNIYWWLTINVIDNGSNPLEGVLVNLYDFFTDKIVNSSTTDSDGIVRFAVLSNVIEKEGARHSENKSYYFKGNYKDYETMDDRSTRMDHNRNRELIFGETLKARDDDGDEVSMEVYFGIAIIILIILLIVSLASRGGRKKNTGGTGKSNDKPRGRQGGYPPRGYRR